MPRPSTIDDRRPELRAVAARRAARRRATAARSGRAGRPSTGRGRRRGSGWCGRARAARTASVSAVPMVPGLVPASGEKCGTYLFRRTGTRGRAFRERVEEWCGARCAARKATRLEPLRSRDREGAKRTDRERGLPRDSVAVHVMPPGVRCCSRRPGSLAGYTRARAIGQTCCRDRDAVDASFSGRSGARP